MLSTNRSPHSLHGGRRGFDKQVWKADAWRDEEGVAVRFELESPDGDEGYPGNLRAEVTYGLTRRNEISAGYFARVDRPCPVNFTNHAYFNLMGEGSGRITGHEAVIHGSHIIEVDKTLIPTGKRLDVAGTPFDFRTRKPIGAGIEAAGGGYDHCYALDHWQDADAGAGAAERLFTAAEIYEPKTGRILKLKTTQPGLQLYTGNFLDGIEGKPGSVYDKHDGFCLETQHFPDSPNQDGFPSALFGPERDYDEKAVFSFSVESGLSG
jgi:aldose 1-epimerase